MTIQKNRLFGIKSAFRWSLIWIWLFIVATQSRLSSDSSIYQHTRASPNCLQLWRSSRQIQVNVFFCHTNWPPNGTLIVVRQKDRRLWGTRYSIDRVIYLNTPSATCLCRLYTYSDFGHGGHGFPELRPRCWWQMRSPPPPLSWVMAKMWIWVILEHDQSPHTVLYHIRYFIFQFFRVARETI